MKSENFDFSYSQINFSSPIIHKLGNSRTEYHPESPLYWRTLAEPEIQAASSTEHLRSSRPPTTKTLIMSNATSSSGVGFNISPQKLPSPTCHSSMPSTYDDNDISFSNEYDIDQEHSSQYSPVYPGPKPTPDLETIISNLTAFKDQQQADEESRAEKSKLEDQIEDLEDNSARLRATINHLEHENGRVSVSNTIYREMIQIQRASNHSLQQEYQNLNSKFGQSLEDNAQEMIRRVTKKSLGEYKTRVEEWISVEGFCAMIDDQFGPFEDEKRSLEAEVKKHKTESARLRKQVVEAEVLREDALHGLFLSWLLFFVYLLLHPNPSLKFW